MGNICFMINQVIDLELPWWSHCLSFRKPPFVGSISRRTVGAPRHSAQETTLKQLPAKRRQRVRLDMALDALGDPKEAGDMLMAGVIYISGWLLTATIQNRDLAVKNIHFDFTKEWEFKHPKLDFHIIRLEPAKIGN